MKEALRLTDAERDSHAWEKVAAHIDERLATLRATCENPNKSEQDRYAAAVRINELKKLQELAQPASQKQPSEDE